jgi:hypothetical protein
MKKISRFLGFFAMILILAACGETAPSAPMIGAGGGGVVSQATIAPVVVQPKPTEPPPYNPPPTQMSGGGQQPVPSLPPAPAPTKTKPVSPAAKLTSSPVVVKPSPKGDAAPTQTPTSAERAAQHEEIKRIICQELAREACATTSLNDLFIPGFNEANVKDWDKMKKFLQDKGCKVTTESNGLRITFTDDCNPFFF